MSSVSNGAQHFTRGNPAVQFDADKARSRRTPLRTDHGEIGEVLVRAAYPDVGECNPMWVILLTAAVDQTDDADKAHGTTNVGLSEGSSGTSLSAVPVGVPHKPRFDEVSTS